MNANTDGNCPPPLPGAGSVGEPGREKPGAGGPPVEPAPQAEVQPFSRGEYAALLLRPQRVIEYVLGGKERLARSIWIGKGIWWLAGMLLAVSVLATIPYGLVAPHADWWKIAVLYCGSLLVCFPSLHSFAQFCGVRLDLGRSFALSLIITATAALFTFGFFPIIWFLNFSITPNENTFIGPRELSNVLLFVSFGLGLVQIGRCLADRSDQQRNHPALSVLFLMWTPLLIFITYRMGTLLKVF